MFEVKSTQAEPESLERGMSHNSGISATRADAVARVLRYLASDDFDLQMTLRATEGEIWADLARITSTSEDDLKNLYFKS